jgi:transporter family protein
MAPASHVAPIDKLSLPLTIVLAVVFLGEPLGWRLAIGVLLMSAGALFTLG